MHIHDSFHTGDKIIRVISSLTVKQVGQDENFTEEDILSLLEERNTLSLEKHSPALKHYSQQQVKAALQRWEIIRPLLTVKQLTRVLVRQRVLDVKAECSGHQVGEEHPSVSIASIYRWIRAFQQSNGDLQSLIPYAKKERAVFQSRLDTTVEEVIEVAIREMHWAYEHDSVDMILSMVVHRLQKINQSRLDHEQLPLPSRATLYRRMKAWAYKEGEEKHLHTNHDARSSIKQKESVSSHVSPLIRSRYEASAQQLTHPHQRVECDFTSLDVLVIDDEDQLPLGRPTVMVMRDCYSGCIIGCALSFEPPSSTMIIEGLFSAIVTKDDVRQQFHTLHDFIGYGVPETLVIGHDLGCNDARLQRICRQLGMEIQYGPPLLGSVTEVLAHKVYNILRTQSAIKDGSSSFPFLMQQLDTISPLLCVTLHDLWSTLYHWIADTYTQEIQSVVRGNQRGEGIPALLWQQALEEGYIPRRPFSPATVSNLLLSRIAERRIQRDGIIIFEHLWYMPSSFSSPLHTYGLIQSGTLAQILYYPINLSRIWALDSASHSWIKFVAEDQVYTAHLSLRKHQVIQCYARSLGTPHAAHTVLQHAKAHLQEVTAAALQRKENARQTLSPQPWREIPLPEQEKVHTHTSSSFPFVKFSQGENDVQQRRRIYTPGNAHEQHALNPKQWRTMTESERYTVVEHMQIKHAHLQSLITELNTCAYFSEKAPPNVPSCLAILGESGVGKTMLVQSWIHSTTLHQENSRAKQGISPYLYVSLPTPVTPKGILATFLQALGDPSPFRGSEWTMMQRLQTLVQASSVRMFFLDEFQHLVNPDTQRFRYASIEVLKQMIDQLGVSMIFLGTIGETEALLRANPQLERRVGTPRILRPFEWKESRQETIREFRHLMKSIDQTLPFDMAGLDEEGLAYSFFYASDGIIGWIMKLIRYAAWEAIHLQAATVSKVLFAAAYDVCIANTTLGMGKINPFVTRGYSPRYYPERDPSLNDELFPYS